MLKCPQVGEHRQELKKRPNHPSRIMMEAALGSLSSLAFSGSGGGIRSPPAGCVCVCGPPVPKGVFIGVGRHLHSCPDMQ